MLTPEKLFDYADKYARKHEDTGKGTQFPTMRKAAKRFRCKLSDIEDAVNDYYGDGYMGIVVAVGMSGVGYAEIDIKGDQYIEAYA